ncbi:WhiB family transcriptional regulator [Aciditerrimonas ferrireducens]|uniref:Transcriptional regulator WhiB n=1 Tax=Aciditerrimonas ferrireducens TaxID=667306 RepID=A0ABV6C2Z2_9ACTN
MGTTSAGRSVQVGGAARRGVPAARPRPVIAEARRWSVEEVLEGAWRDQAACAGAGPAVFFPVGQGSLGQRQAAHAKAICATCPVAEPCRLFALITGQEYGVWGGLDETELRALRAKRRRGRHQGSAPLTGLPTVDPAADPKGLLRGCQGVAS